MDFIYEKKSGKNFADTIESLKKSLSDQKFGVLWEINFKDVLHEKGFDIDANFQVLEICSPAQAKQMLDEVIEVGYLLPCRMVVYEKDSEIRVGVQRPTEQIRIFEHTNLVSKAVEQTAVQVEEKLIEAIKQAV